MCSSAAEEERHRDRVGEIKKEVDRQDGTVAFAGHFCERSSLSLGVYVTRLCVNLFLCSFFVVVVPLLLWLVATITAYKKEKREE